MNYQNETLPEGARKVGSTPSMTEETVVPGILKKHLDKSQEQIIIAFLS
jgi:hypothetical protein